MKIRVTQQLQRIVKGDLCALCPYHISDRPIRGFGEIKIWLESLKEPFEQRGDTGQDA